MDQISKCKTHKIIEVLENIIHELLFNVEMEKKKRTFLIFPNFETIKTIMN